MDLSSDLHKSGEIELVLERHAARRRAGTPTVSVLVGAVEVAVRLYRAWATEAGCPLRIGTAADPAGVAALLVDAARTRDLVADACAYVAARTRTPVAEFRSALVGMTRRDLERFFTAHDPVLSPGPGSRLARRAFETVIGAITPGLDPDAGPLGDLPGLAEMIPARDAPAALVLPPGVSPEREWFRRAVNGAASVATLVPWFHVAVAVSPTGWSEYRSSAPDSRVKALAVEGAVELPVAHREGAEALPVREGACPLPGVVPPLVAGGVSAPFAPGRANAVEGPASTASADDAARSAAERFLFEFLESVPATAGRFELNADPGFRFGPRAAEVDLLAAELRIAVEVDGYFHFRDEDCYRRDRQKDWELQRRGFLVLRFLADDILLRLEDVRDRILAAVALRTTGRTA